MYKARQVIQGSHPMHVKYRIYYFYLLQYLFHPVHDMSDAIPKFSRFCRPHSGTDLVKLIFFMNHYYRRIKRTNKSPRQFALRVNKHVSHRGKNNQDFCLFLNHALEFKLAAIASGVSQSL